MRNNEFNTNSHFSLPNESDPFAYAAEQLQRRVTVQDAELQEYKVLPLTDIFEEEPVDLETFLYDSAFLKGLPRLSPKQTELLELGSHIYYDETYEQLGWERLTDDIKNFLCAMWGKGSGKDTCAQLLCARVAYLLLCLKDPQRYFNMMPFHAINMLNCAVSAGQASEVFFKPLRKMLEVSPWFKSQEMKPLEDRVEFTAKNVHLISGHSDQESLEGNNLILSVLDEIGAFKTALELKKRQRQSMRPLQHSADAIFEMVTSSGKSRFPEVFKVVLISYTRFKGDYITQKYDEGKAAKTRWWVSKAATWEVNPTKTRAMFQDEYDRNPENAKAKYECDPPAAIDQYFKMLTPELIEKTFPYVPASATMLDEHNKPHIGVMADPFLYYAHCDLALSQDRAGLAICRRNGTVLRNILHINPDGTEYVEEVRVPKIKVVALTAFEAPPGKEISIASFRNLFYLLNERHKMLFGKITFDGFQSADSIQQLEERGFAAEVLSIDKTTEPYDTLKDVIYTERLEAYRREEDVEKSVIIVELSALRLINANKIDHMQGGSKDEADALAGAVFNCITAEGADLTEDSMMVGGSYDEQFGESQNEDIYRTMRWPEFDKPNGGMNF